MGIFAELGQALAVAARIRVAILDRNDGTEITGHVVGEISETHVRLRADDGLMFEVAKAALRILDPMEVVS